MTEKDLHNRIDRGAILSRMGSRIIILDGAMGTMIQRGKIDSKCGCCSVQGNMDMLNITNAAAIKEIHKAYIKAGAEIVETNTFSSTSISQKEYGSADKVYELNFNGAKNALEAACEASSDLIESLDAKGFSWKEEWGAKRAIVAGAIGPTIKSLTLAADVHSPESRSISFDEMAVAFGEQAEGLIDGGADVLLIESVYDGLNMKAALYAIEKVLEKKRKSLGDTFDIPVMVSVTINDSKGRILTGQTLESLFTEIANYNILAFGLNCSFGAKDLLPCIREIKSFANSCAISVYPNAGLPDEMGNYKETPSYTAECIREMALEGALNIAGGCCGTTPEHISAIASALADCRPHPINGRSCGTSDKDDLYVAGLDNLLINRAKQNFTNIGERTNVAGSAKFAKLIREQNFAEATTIAAKQIEDGATIIDINTDDTMSDGTMLMRKFLRYLANEPDVAKVPFMIDSSNWETITEGVKNCVGKPIVNSISLKEGEEVFIKKAEELFRLGAAVVVMAFDEKGQAVTFDRKTEICGRAYKLLTDIGFKPSDIIFDCNILTIATGISEHDNYARDYINAVRWIKQNLSGAKTSGGVSNLSFAFRGNNTIRKAMHSVFLYHAIEAGLDMAILNPAMIDLYDDINPLLRGIIEAAIFNDASYLNKITSEQCDNFGFYDVNKKYAEGKSITEILTDLASTIKERELAAKESAGNGAVSLKNQSGIVADASGDVDGRLEAAIIKGSSSRLESDLNEALSKYNAPVDIIEGPLMRGLERVGTLFEEGKMFLPQVVKSARLMKSAVTILQPYIEKYNLEHSEYSGSVCKSGGKPVVVLATAKGDIHDIGKNILSIVLTCNNFEVVDLGVMVENETIVEEAIRRKAAIVAVSGLITPSLKHMEELATLLEENKERMMKELGYLIPLGVGGATTSSVHTAVMIAPKYSGTVIYGRDASTSAVAYKRIVNGIGSEQIKRSQEEIRRQYAGRNIEHISAEDAYSLSEKYPESSYVLAGFGKSDYLRRNISLDELSDKIDWTGFFNFWGYKGVYPEIAERNESAKELYIQATETLKQMIEDGSVEASAILKFYDAYSDKNEMTLLNGTEKVRLGFPRQTTKDSEYLSLADFIVPKGLYEKQVLQSSDSQGNKFAKVGVFVAKVEDKSAAAMDHKSYEYLMRYSLCARLAEALSCKIQEFAEEPVKEAVIKGVNRILRPAFGYNVCSDHPMKRVAFRLLDAEEKIGVRLTEADAIIPTTSVCGLLIAHPKAKYFDV